MRRYAAVLVALNGGQTCVQLFLQKCALLYDRPAGPPPASCFLPDNKVQLRPAKDFLRRLAAGVNEQHGVIDTVFAPGTPVLLPLIERVVEDVVGDYLSSLIDEAHQVATVDAYLELVAAVYDECRAFNLQLEPPPEQAAARGSVSTLGSEDAAPAVLTEKQVFHLAVQDMIDRMFDHHVDLYLQEELDRFRAKCEREAAVFERKAAEQEHETETFLKSGVKPPPDSGDKLAFLTSFKKVLLLPVTSIRVPSPAPRTKAEAADDTSSTSSHVVTASSINTAATAAAAKYNMDNLPSTELAAHAAILNSRLESIKSLFSLEVALDMLQAARESIERCAHFTGFPSATADEAKEQCELIFVVLLENLGFRHIENGFNKALEHLTEYKPPTYAEADDARPPGDVSLPKNDVEPLVTFLELVNVGDLIQQMVDVFYEKELVSRRFVDRTDFLSLSVKEKRRFEQMLDERVASGLNRGIDVLIGQIEYVLRTVQNRNEFNPDGYMVPAAGMGSIASLPSLPAIPGMGALGSPFGLASPPPASHARGSPFMVDIGPTRAAVKIVDILSTHTKLIQGNADKNTMDVFLQEVGLRLYAAVSKHIKKQTISVTGAIILISDLNYYYKFAQSLRQRQLLPYFAALKEIGQLFLIDGDKSKEIGHVMGDMTRFGGIITSEEVFEYVRCRADWILIKRDVEKVVYGLGLVDCTVS
ncbi:exocyst complex component Sec10-like protein [Dipodascopsis tothii]|uniref:exocyst complex component Sec10-like protein n=1 Tax=Dipodascopsis tothii TaxID=44089 RepID=UPI0034CE5E41